MLSINTNLSSLIAQSSMNTSTDKLNQAIERMTTGFKINHAKDNAANYSISTNMTTKIGSYEVAEDNALQGLDMITTAGENLDLINNHVQRLRDLAVQANSGTYGEQSLKAINAEANALVDEINRIYANAEYNGLKLFQAEPTAVTNPITTYSLPRTASNDSKFILDPVSYSYTKLTEMTTITELVNGTTSDTDEYSISTVAELEALADYVNSGNDTTGMTFVLGANLNLSSISNWTPIGDCSTDPNNEFKGTFDGNGYVISNLFINSSSNHQGLFGRSTGEIKNLGLISVDVTGGMFVGALAVYAENLTNCYATGVVSAKLYVGGLVGEAGNIDSCYTDVTVNSSEGAAGGLAECATNVVNSYASGDVTAINGGYVGGLLNYTGLGASIVNCYATGDVIASGSTVGGLMGEFTGTMTNCYATGNVTGDSYVGGLVGTNVYSMTINNSFATGSVTGNSYVGGLVGECYGLAASNGCYSVESGAYATQKTKEEILSSAILEPMGFTEANGWSFDVNGAPTIASTYVGLQKSLADASTPSNTGNSVSQVISLQIGTDADSHSQISFSINFSLEGLEDLRSIGLSTPAVATFGMRSGGNPIGSIERCDEILAIISAKQVEFGAVQNRLESVLEEITIQRENLVSSRSTIRDADMAEVSATYIQQQILQQASATLMSTANQSPAIALQLI